MQCSGKLTTSGALTQSAVRRQVSDLTAEKVWHIHCSRYDCSKQPVDTLSLPCLTKLLAQMLGRPTVFGFRI